MAEGPKIPTELKFFFETDKDFRTIAANGAWVGTTPRRDISIDFFIETLAFPKSITNAVTAEGKLGSEISRTPENQLIRRIQMGVLLTPAAAESLANSILERVANLKKLTEDK